VSQGPFDPSLFKAEGVVLTEGTSSALPFLLGHDEKRRPRPMLQRQRRRGDHMCAPGDHATLRAWSRSPGPAGLFRARPCPVSG